jgi:hypothetical protein
VRELFSKRRSAIEDRMAERGLTSAKVAEVSALDTRQAKSGRVEHTDELRDRWRAEGAEIGWTERDLLAACASASMARADHNSERSLVIPDQSGERTVVRADQPSDHLIDAAFEGMSSPAGLTAHSSSFDRRHVIQQLVDHLPPGPPADWFEPTADRYLDRAEVVALGSDPVKGECYSTVDLLALEQRLADEVTTRRLGERSPEVMPSVVWSCSRNDRRCRASSET